jgi:hypothetical protein
VELFVDPSHLASHNHAVHGVVETRTVSERVSTIQGERGSSFKLPSALADGQGAGNIPALAERFGLKPGYPWLSSETSATLGNSVIIIPTLKGSHTFIRRRSLQILLGTLPEKHSFSAK